MQMVFREVRWSAEKDEQLRTMSGRGGIGLAECAVAIEEGRIIDDIPHPVRSNQRLLILEINNYAVVVPYVRDGEAMFLKTMFPSRYYTARYLRTKQ